MRTIKTNHWNITKDTYTDRIQTGRYKDSGWNNSGDDLDLKFIEPDYETFNPMLGKIPWFWEYKLSNQKEALTDRLNHPETRLAMLMDGEREIGFTLIIGTDNPRKIEIEYMALYPGEEGAGRGWAFFEMAFKELFKYYDEVCWLQSQTNHPHLTDYYHRKGMTLTGVEEVKDFHPHWGITLDGAENLQGWADPIL